jgi:hypothetical protein
MYKKRHHKNNNVILIKTNNTQKKMTDFWFNDPKVLLSKPLQFFPAPDMPCIEKTNAFARLTIYGSILAWFNGYDLKNIAYASTGVLVLSMLGKKDMIKPIEQMNPQPENKKPENYLGKMPGEPFAGARDIAFRLTSSSREVPGRSVIASSKQERIFKSRPISNRKGIDSNEYDYMSGSQGTNKYYMNKV